MFKYETHLHSSASSACGKSTPEEEVHYYKEKGYTGIFITEHFWFGNTCIDKSLPWEEWVSQYCDAYRRAKAEGDLIGLQVFFGWETTYGGADFLVYGLDEEWLRTHPEIIEVDEKGQYELVKKSGGYVFQAHPFRERNYQHDIRLHPHHCDAFEVANACNVYYQDYLAYDFAVAHEIPMTAGSDLHKIGATHSHCLFGVETETKLESEKDYAERVIRGEVKLHIPESWFDGVRNENPYYDVFVYDENNERVLHEEEFYHYQLKAKDPVEVGAEEKAKREERKAYKLMREEEDARSKADSE